MDDDGSDDERNEYRRDPNCCRQTRQVGEHPDGNAVVVGVDGHGRATEKSDTAPFRGPHHVSDVALMLKSPPYHVEKFDLLRPRKCARERVLDPVGDRTSQKTGSLARRVAQERSRRLVDEPCFQTHLFSDLAHSLQGKSAGLRRAARIAGRSSNPFRAVLQLRRPLQNKRELLVRVPPTRGVDQPPPCS